MSEKIIYVRKNPCKNSLLFKGFFFKYKKTNEI